MKRYPEPDQHLVYFNPKEKQTSTQGIANTGKGKNGQTTEQTCWSKGALQKNSSSANISLTRHFPLGTHH